MKKVVKGFGVLILIVFIGAGVYIGLKYNEYKKSINESAGTSTELVEFTIEEGESTDLIAQKLYEAGLIKNVLYFKIYIKQSGIASLIQAGTFKVPQNVTMKDLGETLQHAANPDIWVTIPEGLMGVQIADLIEEGFVSNTENSFDKATFLELIQSSDPANQLGIPIPEGQPLEGYLYPDTYRFPADATTEYVLTAILNNFDNKVIQRYSDDIEKSGRSLYDTLILASILERETKHPDDRPIVADILIRRLDNNWPLGVDATLLYYFGDWTHVITEQDLQVETSYNTRKQTGLTPTPIANPGDNTISGVIHPEANDYWYYISDSEGILHYAVTEAEHNANIQEYLW